MTFEKEDEIICKIDRLNGKLLKLDKEDIKAQMKELQRRKAKLKKESELQDKCVILNKELNELRK